ncbi:MAG: sigma 54-interacting transcriptional regulator [Myxococcales bacterium]|nr:sigma 54-interacting transcriptional regulator [Myxococcales bacterium]
MDTTVTGGSDLGRDDGGWVLLASGAGTVRAFGLPADGEVVIGRDAGCQLVLDHERVSRRHARVRAADGWTVADLGSRNGTQVRGASVAAGAAAPLVPGEAFTIGPFTIVIVPRAVSVVRAAIGGAGITIDDPTLAQPTSLVRAVAQSPVNVIVAGETGTGKEVLTRALHRLSGRGGPMLAVNCAALAPALLESELFGHEKGSFTGAATAKAGLLEAAAGGTVLFDEIGELPLELQAKLLRAIENREVLRVGAVRPLPIDVRFVAATHRDLAAAVGDGSFRRDLFYRLAGITLTVAPLRERRHRVAELAARFAQDAAGRADALTPDAVARLMAHDWPGNVRELKNAIERAVLLAEGGPVRAAHVLFDAAPAASAAGAASATSVPSAPVAAASPVAAAAAPPGLSVAEADERARIIAALDACAGNQTKAAQRLGVSRATLVTKLRLYRIPRPKAGAP